MKSTKKGAKAAKPPFSLSVGIVKAGKYGFRREPFTSAQDMFRRAAQIAAKIGYTKGLRELQIAFHA